MSSRALRARITRCADHLAHASRLARLAVRGPEPARAARYLVGAVADLADDLRFLRRQLRQRARPK